MVATATSHASRLALSVTSAQMRKPSAARASTTAAATTTALRSEPFPRIKHGNQRSTPITVPSWRCRSRDRAGSAWDKCESDHHQAEDPSGDGP